MLKKLILISIVAPLAAYSQKPFEFKSYKDSNGFLEKSFLAQLADAFHPDIFFETGTYAGQTTEHAVPYFKEIHTVELHDGMFKNARAKLAQFKSVSVYHGKSPDVISQVAPALEGTILFWLDAHYSGNGTAMSSDNAQDPNTFTAIRNELRAIKELGIRNCIVLIDDIRGFGTKVRDQEYVACSWYPTLQEVKHSLLEINPHYEFALVGDIFFAYDAELYHPEFTQTVKACTKTRLYNGYNLSEDELFGLEKIIMHAPEQEKQFIKKLYAMIDYDNFMFWHPLSCGLVDLGACNYEQAATNFSNAKRMLQGSSRSTGYNHERIDEYLRQSSRCYEELNKYKNYLEQGTYQGQDWSSFKRIPKSRYDTFLTAFEHFERTNGRVVVELGTTRSFVHGGLIGCNSDDTRYWTPGNPENWDWGAGGFTRVAAECLAHLNPIMHTVDLAYSHIERCKVITADFASILTYHVCSSLDFLRTCPFKIDLLYLDTGDMTPIEPTAELQLEEVKIIVARDLLADDGIILIDDVRNQTPKLFGEASDLGKSKYSIPYLLEHGYELVADEYQVILKRKK